MSPRIHHNYLQQNHWRNRTLKYILIWREGPSCKTQVDPTARNSTFWYPGISLPTSMYSQGGYSGGFGMGMCCRGLQIWSSVLKRFAFKLIPYFRNCHSQLTRFTGAGPLKLTDKRGSLKHKEIRQKLLLLGIQTGHKLAKLATVLCRLFSALLSLLQFGRGRLFLVVISFYALLLLFGPCRRQALIYAFLTLEQV